MELEYPKEANELRFRYLKWKEGIGISYWLHIIAFYYFWTVFGWTWWMWIWFSLFIITELYSGHINGKLEKRVEQTLGFRFE